MLLSTGQVINILHVIIIDEDDPMSEVVNLALTGHLIQILEVNRKDAQLIRNAVINLNSHLITKLL